MKPLSSSDLVDLVIDIAWKNSGITHRETYFAEELNCWRDVFPGSQIQNLMENRKVSRLLAGIKPGELVPVHDPGKVFFLPWSRLEGAGPDPFRVGRFYPQEMILGHPGIFRENRRPFRCIGRDKNGIWADLNHPLAKMPLTLELSVQRWVSKPEERGGACTDWMELALSGPGMQTRYNNAPTDFFSGNSLDRRDPDPDPQFYRTDRWVHHVDEKARQNLSQIYSTLLHPGEKVLDLMAGWDSHLPGNLELSSVHGIGLNENEMKTNPALSSHHCQDLNQDPYLDFNYHSFDAVICSLSVEYLVDPVPIFQEAARVIKPGGIFAVTFSNRWFPEKAVRVWEDLHDFERMGMVMEVFLAAGTYDAISTFSRRGDPRPFEDRYFPGIRQSDPVYAVMGKTSAQGRDPETGQRKG